MDRTGMRWMVLGLALAMAGTAMAQPRRDIGKREYDNSCASCHGAAGKGDGPMVRYLVSAPPDLTLLARRNGGVFPAQRVSDAIDGRGATEIGPHGSREMPVWGDVYRGRAVRAGEDHGESEWYARSRVLALLDYLARIQQ